MHKDIKKEMGERIRLIRKRRGLTQEELALKCRMDSKSIGAVERGERNITIENLARIADALGVHLYQFFLFKEKDIISDASVAKMRIEEILKNADDKTLIHLAEIVRRIIAFYS